VTLDPVFRPGDKCSDSRNSAPWPARPARLRPPACRTVVTVDRMPETHFDEWTASRYATLWPELFDRR
jgi:hypothetical protein